MLLLPAPLSPNALLDDFLDFPDVRALSLRLGDSPRQSGVPTTPYPGIWARTMPLRL